MKKDKTNVKIEELKENEIKLNAAISFLEKKKLDAYLFAKNKSIVNWIKEKISELPEYEVKLIPRQRTG